MNTIISLVTNGKLNKVASAEISSILNQFEGKRIELIIKKARSKRSDNQNRYYWGCVVKIVRQGLKDLGYILSSEETHDFLKDKFLDYELMSNNHGEEIGKIYKSTTELTKTEFGEYIEQIQIFAAEILNVTIPDPNQQTEIF